MTLRNITIATFGMLWGYKKEGILIPSPRKMSLTTFLAYQANPWAGKILSEHDIPVAYKSDHPVKIHLRQI